MIYFACEKTKGTTNFLCYITKVIWAASKGGPFCVSPVCGNIPQE